MQCRGYIGLGGGLDLEPMRDQMQQWHRQISLALTETYPEHSGLGQIQGLFSELHHTPKLRDLID